MRVWFEIVKLEIKRQAKSKLFWLLLFFLIALSIQGNFKYFRNYQMTSPSDLTAIAKSSISDDVSIPLSGKDRNDYFIKQIAYTFKTNNVQDYNKIMEWLSPKIHSRDTWTEEKLMEIQYEMFKKFPSFNEFEYSKRMLYEKYTMSEDKRDATYSEFMSYLFKTKQTFSTSFARQYATTTAIYASIIFISLFAFLFQKEQQSSLYELLLSKPISKFTYVLGRFTGAFSMCMLAIALNTTLFSIWEIISCKQCKAPLYLGALWRDTLFYTVPSVLFFASLMVFVSLLFKNGFAALPLFFITMLSSSITTTLSDGSTVQWMWLSPLLVGYDKFYQLVPPQQIQVYIMNRIALLILSAILLLASCAIWARNGQVLKLGQKLKNFQNLKIKSSNSKESTHAFPFLRYNSKISASKIQLSIAFILILSTITTMSGSRDITEIGRSILGNMAWASVIIFANIYSIEYSHKTMDTFYLTKKNKLGVMALRILINLFYLFVMVSIAFFIALFIVDKTGMDGRTMGTVIIISYFKTIITCMACALFFGVCSMTVSNFFGNGLAGIVGGFLINVGFMSAYKKYSLFNIYISVVHITTENQDAAIWWKSALFFVIISFLIFILNKGLIYWSGKLSRLVN